MKYLFMEEVLLRTTNNFMSQFAKDNLHHVMVSGVKGEFFVVNFVSPLEWF